MISFKAKRARNLLENAIGLLGADKPFPIILTTRLGIHTFGLKYPIDVLILDKNSKVRFLKENLEPNRLFFWNFKYNQVLELPVQTIKRKGIKLGDRVTLAVDVV